MRSMKHWMLGLAVWGLTSAAFASDAQTSATAGSNRNSRNGTAQATASYEGDVGFARTDSRSGRVNQARGVAVGVDEDGLSLSVSQAIAPNRGPALATNLNIAIGNDGRVSTSVGTALANGPLHNEATAGGQATAAGRNSTAQSLASGNTDRFGRVIARTDARQTGPRLLTVRPAPPRIVAPHARRVVHVSNSGITRRVVAQPRPTSVRRVLVRR